MRENLFAGGVILHDPGRRVLLQHRDSNAHRFPLHWGVFGGSAEGDETAAEAAVREVREELGLELSESELELVYALDVDTTELIGEVHYFAAPLAVPLERLTLMEGDDMGLFSQAQLDDLKLIPHARIALDRFFAGLVD